MSKQEPMVGDLIVYQIANSEEPTRKGRIAIVLSGFFTSDNNVLYVARFDQPDILTVMFAFEVISIEKRLTQ